MEGELAAGEIPSGRHCRPLALFAARVGLLLLAAAWAGAAPAGTVRPTVVEPTQELAALLSAHSALSEPDTDSAILALVPARRPITEERTVLPVLGHRTGADGGQWLRVRLPGRPNGRTGWISRKATASSVATWHVIVATSLRRVSLYHRGRRVRVFAAIVGKPSTPTPRGEFFVEEAIQLPIGAVGTPYALALSARSNVLQEFAGGPGQIALHGLRNVGGVLGTAVSHGCVRLATGAMQWLITRIGPGTPVTITR